MLLESLAEPEHSLRVRQSAVVICKPGMSFGGILLDPRIDLQDVRIRFLAPVGAE